MAIGAPRDLKKESHWRKIVGRQARSGLTVRDWCCRHGVKEANLYWWRLELARRDAESTCGEGFVPVRVTEDEPASVAGWIEITLACGRRIQVRGRVDRAMLADVVGVLEGRGC